MFKLDLLCLLDPEALQEFGEECGHSCVFVRLVPPVYDRNLLILLHGVALLKLLIELSHMAKVTEQS